MTNEEADVYERRLHRRLSLGRSLAIVVGCVGTMLVLTIAMTTWLYMEWVYVHTLMDIG